RVGHLSGRPGQRPHRRPTRRFRRRTLVVGFGASAHSLGREAMATEVIVRPREGLSVELNGINVISSGERKGSRRDLFWPWCAAHIAVLGISYGSCFVRVWFSFWPVAVAGSIDV